ncbi:F0F1 ATP synthase subunit B [Candidatus Saccharibacteria bacterium]|nr:F0F1 ATP synthase subunit B [Candidatus Saccharibacteria bacterium]
MTNVIQPLTQFAAETSEASGIGALGIDLKAFVIQLITFLLAFWVLKRFAFTPIIKVMDERRQTIESGVTLGEEMQKKTAELDAKVEATLQKARQEADGIIADAQDAAKQSGAAIEAKAQTKAKSLLAEAEDRIVQDTQRARQKLEGELAGLVAEATEAIIDEKVDAKKDADLIDKALKGDA